MGDGGSLDQGGSSHGGAKKCFGSECERKAQPANCAADRWHQAVTEESQSNVGMEPLLASTGIV